LAEFHVALKQNVLSVSSYFFISDPFAYVKCQWKGTAIAFSIYTCTFRENCVWELTDKIQEGECDQQVGSPVEAVGECEGPSSDRGWKYFTQEKPGHWSKTKRNCLTSEL